MENPIIELVGLTKLYGSLKAVDHLDLTIQKGEIYGLLGPNGAGKTTTILMMLGLTEPTNGKVRVCGYDSTSQPVAVKQKVGYMPDNLGFYDNMNALDNLVYMARLNGLAETDVRQRAIDMMNLVGLSKAMHKKTGTYSRGMKQRLGLAEVLIKQPEVIILDEPTLGIDPAGVKEFLSFIRQLNRQHGITVLLSSHHLNQVQQVCDRVGIFVEGKLLANDHIDGLSAQLFPKDNHIIMITLAAPLPDVPKYQEELTKLGDVKHIEVNDNIVEISSTRNATPEFVRFFVEKGHDIMGVSRKEHGLEEIYHRYFENSLTENVSNGKSAGLLQKSFFRRMGR